MKSEYLNNTFNRIERIFSRGIFLMLIVFNLIPSMLSAQVTFYVSPSGNDQLTGKSESAVPGDGPLATLQVAVDRVRSDFLKTGGKEYKIILREGIYFVYDPIEITPADRFTLSIEAYPGEKPVISAGKKITGWKKGKVNGKNCWKVNLPEVKSGDYYFRQLFVNSNRAVRPRLPVTGFYEVEDPLLAKTGTQTEQYENAARDRFIFKAGDIKNWKNLQDVNVMVLHYWQEDYLPIKEVNMEKREVIFNAKSYMSFLLAHPAHGVGNAWYYVDNIFEALDSPGEWYLDRPAGDLYYIPKPGEKINETEIYAPVSSQVIRITGNSEENKYAGNIHIVGLGFRHNEIVWIAHYGTGNNFGNSGPAMISFSFARDCSISECDFTNLGEYAIEIQDKSERIYITGNNFSDMGAGAVKMKDCSNIYVTDNEIQSGGRIFHGAVALLANVTKYCRFLQNHISDFYYSGIVCSAYRNNPGCYDNLILKNHIHNIGQGWLSDMGGIYVPGLQPGMKISGNVIHDINSAVYGANAIYLDDHAQHIIVEKNLLYKTNKAIVNFKGTENVIRNNILAFGGLSVLRRASSAGVEEKNIASIYKNVILVNNTCVHRTQFDVPLFEPGYWSDLNVIWNYGNEELKVEQPVKYGKPSIFASYNEWVEKTKNDLHSVIGDPLCKDPMNGDFTLSPGSIVYRLGIDPGTFEDVGPRPKAEWELMKVKAASRESSTEGHIE